MINIAEKTHRIILHLLTRQFLKYVLVGLLNTGVFYGIYYVMIQLGYFYALAVTVGTVIGIINSYFWNKFFTFRSKTQLSVNETLRFFTVYFIQYLSNLLIIYLCITYANISEELAGLIAISIGVFISYFGHKLWSFRTSIENEKVNI